MSTSPINDVRYGLLQVPKRRARQEWADRFKTALTLGVGAAGIVAALQLPQHWDEWPDRQIWMGPVLALAVLVPLVLAVLWSNHCEGWLDDRSRRCNLRRRGIFKRCQHHPGIVLHDSLSIIAVASALVSGFLIWRGLA